MADLVLNIDKPSGPTSFAVVSRVRRLCRIPKAGHAGTLDPLASGVLLVLLGQATRIARYLEALPKEYEADVRLGVETETDDLEGRVISEKPVPGLTKGEVVNLLESFTGEIEQVPPKFSALKKGGVPLYKLARQGRQVEPDPRRVFIYGLELVDMKPDILQIRVKCSKGTYLRSLARDIGRSLGCGGILSRLRRTAVGHFTGHQAVGLDELDPESAAAKGFSIDQALSFIPEVELNADQAVKAGHGNVIAQDSGRPSGSVLRLKHGRQLLALGRAWGRTIRPECVFSR
jgi:tRNA pseudouridine55 synthase